MMMITTSQCFPLLLFNYSEEFWAPSIFLFSHVCNAAFPFSFGSNCFYLGTISWGGVKNYIFTC